jgi:hypothetical protein
MAKFRTGVAIAALMITAPATAVSDVTGMTADRYVSMFNERLGQAPGAAHAKPSAAAVHAERKDCAAIRAFNEKAPSMAGMEPLPCHCIPASERADKVYAKPPPGFTCGNLRQSVPSWAHMF